MAPIIKNLPISPKSIFGNFGHSFRTFERSNIGQTLVNLLLSLDWYGTSDTDEDVPYARVFCENDGPTRESLESKN